MNDGAIVCSPEPPRPDWPLPELTLRFDGTCVNAGRLVRRGETSPDNLESTTMLVEISDVLYDPGQQDPEIGLIQRAIVRLASSVCILALGAFSRRPPASNGRLLMHVARKCAAVSG